MTPLLALLLLFPVEIPQNTAAPQSFEQVLRRADKARAADRLAEAIALYQRGTAMRPSWSEGWWWLATIYYEQDRFQEAQAAFTRFIANAKNPAPAYAFLGLCEYETHDYEQANKHFVLWAAKGSPGNAQLIDVATFRWALLMTRDGRFTQALYLLSEKVKSHGVSPTLAEAMGLATLEMRNLPEDYPSASREMVWLAGEASAYGARREFDRAHEFANHLLAHYGTYPNTHYLKAMLYTLEKRSDEAAAEYKEELKVSPKNALAMVQLALIDLDNSRVEEATAMAQNAVAVEPGNPLVHFVLGRALLAKNDLEGSVRELETAKRLAPASAKVRFQLAKAYKRLGRKADAERENAAFEQLQDKEEVLATADEKLRQTGQDAGQGRGPGR